MTTRHALLVAAGVVVLGATVYLALEVRTASTAAASAKPSGPSDPVTPAKRDRDLDREPVKRPPPAKTPNGGTLAQVADPAPVGPSTPPPGTAKGSGSDEPKLETIMAQANDAYDHGEFEDAKAIAHKVILRDPTNSRMLRILVSTACIEVNEGDAQKYYDQMTDSDKRDMRTRCSRYNVTFK